MTGSAWRQIRDCMLRQRNLHQPHDRHAHGWVTLEVWKRDPESSLYEDWFAIATMFHLFEDRVPQFRLKMMDRAESVGMSVGSFKPVSGALSPLDDF